MEAVVLEIKYKELVNEYEILHLLYHRNRNQHGSAEWWGVFNILHRQLRQLIKLLVDIQHLKTKKTVDNRKERIYSIIRYLINKKIFTRGYYQFNGIIALGQYITLGLALVGNLAKIHQLLLEFEGVHSKLQTGAKKAIELQKKTVAGTLQQENDLGEELGEVIQEDKKRKQGNTEVFDVFSSLPKSKKQKKKNLSTEKADVFGSEARKDSFSEKTKKEKKSMDDIFGDKSKKKKQKKAIDDIFGDSSEKQKESKSMDDIFGGKPKKKKAKPNSIGDIFGDAKPKKKKKTKKNDIDDIFG